MQRADINTTGSMDDIPVDVINMIMKLLPAKDLAMFSSVGRKYRKAYWQLNSSPNPNIRNERIRNSIRQHRHHFFQNQIDDLEADIEDEQSRLTFTRPYDGMCCAFLLGAAFCAGGYLIRENKPVMIMFETIGALLITLGCLLAGKQMRSCVNIASAQDRIYDLIEKEHDEPEETRSLLRSPPGP